MISIESAGQNAPAPVAANAAPAVDPAAAVDATPPRVARQNEGFHTRHTVAQINRIRRARFNVRASTTYPGIVSI